MSSSEIELKKINFPNFFVLGAGKSGTSSLYFYLKQHPEIFMSEVKEPTFFCEEFQVVKNVIDYFKLFDSVKEETVIGEASHSYLTNPSTARVLHAIFPKAKFVVIFRNPVDRAYSLYHQMRRLGYERVSTFRKALKLEKNRLKSKKFKKNCPNYFGNFLYFHSGLYGEQVERYFSFFPREQFYFLTLNQLQTDPENTFMNILRFLNVDSGFRPEFTVLNPGLITTRVPAVQYFWHTKMKHPLWLRNLGLNALEKVNFKEIPVMEGETRKSLLLRYKDDLEKLYKLTGLRLR